MKKKPINQSKYDTSAHLDTAGLHNSHSEQKK